ncbi:MAG: LCP family protein [Selenomonadaceae bacterium]
MNPTIRPRHKKKKKWPWILASIFVLAAIAGAIFASSGFFDEKVLPRVAEEGMLVAKDKSSIMIMGIDQRDDDVGRSDTLMIATIDPKKDQASLLSIPRDTRVKVKGYGFDKINAAYAYGGHKLTQDTVEKFLGVPMNHYVIINIQAFQRVIDAIGGIDINVEKRMYYSDPWDDDGGLVIDLQKGEQHMDGKTAITYVRYRDEEGDIGRVHRQQNFMKALMDKMVSPAIIPQIPSIIKEVLSSVKTDLSFREMLEFAGTLREAQKNGLKTEMVPGRPLYINEISYWIPDITKLRNILANTLDITMNPSMRTAMEREEYEYENSIPSTATKPPSSDFSIGRENKSSTSSSLQNKKNTIKPKTTDTEKSSGRTDSSAAKSKTTRGADQPAQPEIPQSAPISPPSRTETGTGKSL